MAIDRLAHYSVRTTDLAASRRFYIEGLGFREGYRPPFAFPGHWLYRDEDESDHGVVHLVGVDADDPQGLKAYLGDKTLDSLSGSGAVDHLAFIASGLQEVTDRLRRMACDYRERTVPSLGLHQVFVEDPSGITIELNFSAHEVR